MAQPYDVCIRGSGIVGRTLALLLARDRLRVALVQSPQPPQGATADVRAYALNAASRQLLESVRCWPEEDTATPVQAMQVKGDQDGAVRFDAPPASALAWIVDVPVLEARLADAVRYQPLVDTVDSPVPAALTVVCEGRASSSRAEFGVEFDSTPYPQQAIAARLVCEKLHNQTALQWFSGGNILAFLPLGGPAGNSVALVWSVETSLAPELLALPAEDFCQRLEEASHQALGQLRLSSERASWPLQLARARRWSGVVPSAGAPAKTPRSWVLAGDAAHTVHPLSGQGLNLGLADVQALALILHSRDYWRSVGDPRLLRRYERERKAGVLPTGWATDGLQQLFAQQTGALQSLRNWGMRRFDQSGPLKAWVAHQAAGL